MADLKIVAWRIREGDQMLMPDGKVWCTIESIQRVYGTGRLLFLFVEPGFAQKDPDAIVQIRRETP